MSERKWTPGPWVIDDMGIWGCRVLTKAPNLNGDRVTGHGSTDGFVCGLGDAEYYEYSNADEQLANAQLIAAAPDLYKALEMAALWLEYDGRYDVNGMKLALAKARGETN